LLLIDNDKAIGRMLDILLRGEHYRITWALSGRDGLALASANRPDLIILELSLPDIDGFALLQSLREWVAVPMMILSVRGAVEDKVRALNGGANDYMTKPFAGEELLARLRVLQRSEPVMTDPPILIAGPVRVDMATHNVTIDGEAVVLTATEDAIFYLLARHVGRCVSCAHLVGAVWGADLPEKIDELREYIWRLRRKFQMKGAENLIRSHGRTGYMLASPLAYERPSIVA
jgi:two-component system KDP operon response regulator KdpE